jgi:hypothetical protein
MAPIDHVIVDDLGFDINLGLSWFPHDQDTPFVIVRVTDTHTKDWPTSLGPAFRRCYLPDSLIDERTKALGVSPLEIVCAKLPEAGSTMAGDFGEILVYFYQAVREFPKNAFGPKKWRLKQDRTKPAPYSDVITFVLPNWPAANEEDIVICAEVKTKSTDGDSAPIAAAIKDIAKDRTSRLARTLVWLRERALLEDLGDVKIAHLDRFINATDHPPAIKRFRAVAVVCSSLIDEELVRAPVESLTDYEVVVIVVPRLKETYTAVFEAARHSDVAPVLPALTEGSA